MQPLTVSKIAGLGMALSLSVTLVSSPAIAVEPWNQEKVAGLAEQLRKATSGVRTQIRNQPPPTVGSRQARQYYELQDKLRVLESETRAFAAALKDGQGQDQTVTMYERIQMLRRDAAQLARQLMLTDPVVKKIAKAREILIQIAPYYSSDWEKQFGTGRQVDLERQ